VCIRVLVIAFILYKYIFIYIAFKNAYEHAKDLFKNKELLTNDFEISL